MRNSLLLISFCSLFLFSQIYAQDNILKDGFCIKTDPEKKEVYLPDINETKCIRSPRDSNNIPLNLIAIEDNFLKERKEMEKSIFSEDEIGRLKKLNPIATIYINSKTRKIDAVSFLLRDMNKDDINSINTRKFAEYREMLKKQITIQSISFKREIMEYGYVNQSFIMF